MIELLRLATLTLDQFNVALDGYNFIIYTVIPVINIAKTGGFSAIITPSNLYGKIVSAQLVVLLQGLAFLQLHNST